MAWRRSRCKFVRPLRAASISAEDRHLLGAESRRRPSSANQTSTWRAPARTLTFFFFLAHVAVTAVWIRGGFALVRGSHHRPRLHLGELVILPGACARYHCCLATLCARPCAGHPRHAHRSSWPALAPSSSPRLQRDFAQVEQWKLLYLGRPELHAALARAYLHSALTSTGLLGAAFA